MGNSSSSKLSSKTAVKDIIRKHNLTEDYAFELEIPNPEVWMKLATVGSDRVFSRTTMVKAVVQHFYKPSSGSSTQVLHPPVLYFLNSQAYQTHLPFCANIMHALKEHLSEDFHFDSMDFNMKNYKLFPRQFVLLSIVFYAESETIGVELWPGDNLPAQAIKETHELLRENLFFGDRIKWRVASPLHDSQFRQVEIPNFYPDKVLFDADLFSNVVYQPLHMGISYGICRIWKNADAPAKGHLPALPEDALTLSTPSLSNNAANTSSTSSHTRAGSSLGTACSTTPPSSLTTPLRTSLRLSLPPIEVDEHGAPIVDRRTILVTELLPLDLNPVRALITAQLQTPLCHVALLCSNRGTPNMALRTALADFADYDGKLIKLVVNHGDFSVALADESEEKLWDQQLESVKAARVTPQLHLDTRTSGLVLLRHVRMIEDMLSTDAELEHATAIAHSIGSKALNLARFLGWDLQPVNNTGNNISFVIPFSYFSQYTALVAEEEISRLRLPETSETEARALCRVIREKILKGKIPKQWQLIEMVKGHIVDWKKEVQFGASKNPARAASSSTGSPGTGLTSKNGSPTSSIAHSPSDTTSITGATITLADGVIFRSSTNCEDLPGFPSAGLYVSEKVKMSSKESSSLAEEDENDQKSKHFKNALGEEEDDLNELNGKANNSHMNAEEDDEEADFSDDDDQRGILAKKFEKAILTVWASTFLEKAYLERREFGIDESKVAMAILVMPLFSKNVKANGVAVTTNPYRADLGGNYLNVQNGVTAVTDACDGAAPEQVIFIHDGFKDLTIEYLSSSSLVPKGEHIITTDIARKLNGVLSGIHRGFKTMHTVDSKTNAADVEFLILHNNDIVILQARPVKVQHRPR